MKNFIREPLLWFLIAGALLFGLFEWTGRRADNVIVVDDRALIRWVGFQQKAFNEEAAKAFLASLSEDQRAELIDRYVDEEATYREALALGLDRNDAIIRKRLLQKMDFILLGTGQGPAITEDDLQAHFEVNRDEYRLPAEATLSHVYFKDGEGIAEALAQLRDGANPLSLGDRFPFHRNYVEAEPQMIADHLGPEIAVAVWSVGVPVGEWVGPYRSPLGHHLLLIRKRVDARDASLEDVAGRVLTDLRDIKQRERRKKAQEAIRDRYQVEVR